TDPDGASAGRSIILKLGYPVTVTGAVFDGSIVPPLPLAGVPVRIEGSDRTATTDAHGAFRLTDVTTGTRVLLVDGYSARGTLGRARIGIRLETDKALPAIVLRPVRYDLGTPIVVNPDGSSPEHVIRNAELPFVEVRVPAGRIELPPSAPRTFTVS